MQGGTHTTGKDSDVKTFSHHCVISVKQFVATVTLAALFCISGLSNYHTATKDETKMQPTESCNGTVLLLSVSK